MKRLSVLHPYLTGRMQKILGKINFITILALSLITVSAAGIASQESNFQGTVIKNQDQPQDRTITGTVTDANGLPVLGASVVVQGTNVGTITDASGKFQLEIPSDAETLQISFVGMATQDVAIGNLSDFNISVLELAGHSQLRGEQFHFLFTAGHAYTDTGATAHNKYLPVILDILHYFIKWLSLSNNHFALASFFVSGLGPNCLALSVISLQAAANSEASEAPMLYISTRSPSRPISSNNFFAC